MADETMTRIMTKLHALKVGIAEHKTRMAQMEAHAYEQKARGVTRYEVNAQAMSSDLIDARLELAGVEDPSRKMAVKMFLHAYQPDGTMTAGRVKMITAPLEKELRLMGLNHHQVEALLHGTPMQAAAQTQPGGVVITRVYTGHPPLKPQGVVSEYGRIPISR